MNSAMRRIAAQLAATTLVGVVAVSGSTAARAWTLGTQVGTATFSPASGTDGDTPTINTSGGNGSGTGYGSGSGMGSGMGSGSSSGTGMSYGSGSGMGSGMS